MQSSFCIVIAGFVSAGWLVAFGANAALSPRQIATHPTNICQSALPAYDVNVRKRPLAVQNEGSSPVFVTCSYPSGEGRSETRMDVVTRVRQYLVNNNPLCLLFVQCTGVTGSAFSDENQYVTKGVLVPSQGSNYMIWRPDDFAGSPSTFPGFGLFSISCQLPPGAGLGEAYIDSDTEIGD
jgi:hypothetical protein